MKLNIKTSPLKLGRRVGLASSLVIATLALPAIGFSQITQVANDSGVGWNDSTLWSDSSAAHSGATYTTASGLGSSGNTYLGTSVSGRVRGLSSSATFGGDSLTVVANSEILLKDATTYSANVILDGGALRWAPNSSGNATMDGTLNVNSESYLGVSQTGNSTLTVNSAITGSGLLHVAAGTSSTATGYTLGVTFGGDLSGYTGTFDIGGGGNGGASFSTATISFAQAYNLPSLSMLMGDYSTPDILDLNYDLTVGSFAFNGTSLTSGTYTVSDLNTQFGNGSQFAGTGSLTVAAVPEPGSMTLASLGGGLMLVLALRRRKIKQC